MPAKIPPWEFIVEVRRGTDTPEDGDALTVKTSQIISEIMTALRPFSTHVLRDETLKSLVILKAVFFVSRYQSGVFDRKVKEIAQQFPNLLFRLFGPLNG